MVMRMLAEMAVANPSTGSFADYSRDALGHWAGFSVGWLYWYFWVIVVGFEAIAGREDHPVLDRHPTVAVRVDLHGLDDRDEPVLGEVLRRVRVLVRRHQGGGDRGRSSRSALLRVRAVAGQVGGLLQSMEHGGFMPMGVGVITVGIVTVIFSMVGAEIATIAAAESADPEKGGGEGRQLGDPPDPALLRRLDFLVGDDPAVERQRIGRLAVRRRVHQDGNPLRRPHHECRRADGGAELSELGDVHGLSHAVRPRRAP